jgi:isoleucyl-tRNA synthetase
VDIQSEDVPGWMVAAKNSLTVALDVTISDELEQEGNARELVNRIQRIRKDSGYALTDRVLVKMTYSDKLVRSIEQFNDYICAEILADRLELVEVLTEGNDIEVNDISLKVLVEKKG